MPTLVPALGVPLLFGIGIVSLLGLRFRDDRLAYFGWVYVAGALATALVLLVWTLACTAVGQPLHLALIRVPLMLLAVATAVLGTRWPAARRRGLAAPGVAAPGVAAPGVGEPGAAAPVGRLYLLAVLACLGYGLLLAVGASGRAIMMSDEAYIWSLKAKMIFVAGGFGPGFDQLAAELVRPDEYVKPFVDWFHAVVPNLPESATRALPQFGRPPSYHLDYPLIDPLLQLWTFLCAGEITHWENRVPIQAAMFALLLVLAGALRRVCRPLLAAGLLACFLPLHATRDAFLSANADGLLALGVLVAIDAIRRHRAEGGVKWLRLAALGVGCAVFAKNEGWMYAVVLGVALAAGHRSLRVPAPALRWALLPAGIVAFTLVSNRVHGFGNDLVQLPAGGGLERVPDLLHYLWTRVYAGPPLARNGVELQCNYAYPLFLAVVLLYPRRLFARPATLFLLGVLAVQFLVYLRTPHSLVWHLETSALRFTWQAIPALLLWLGATYGELTTGEGASVEFRSGLRKRAARDAVA